MRLASFVAAALLLSGCGHALPAGLERTAASLAARADSPDIAQQIAGSLLGTDDRGSRVKKLPVPGSARPVTFLGYKALDNSLSDMLPAHLNVLERAGSSTSANVVVFADGNGPKDAVEYYVRQDADAKKVTSPYMAVNKAGEVDSGDPATLEGAVRWAARSYPSTFRWVDVNSHGGGYYGICEDDQSSSLMKLHQLPGALGAAGKLDLLTFDACLMASVEVAYELRSTAKVMVASEDASYPLGMNYDQTLGSLGASPDATALARDLVVRSQRTGADPATAPIDPGTGKVAAIATLSAIDLSRMDYVKQTVDKLAVALIADLPREHDAIMMSLKAVKPFMVAGPDRSDFNHRDLHEVTAQLLERVSDPAVKAACQSVGLTLFNRGGAILISRAQNGEMKVPRGLSVYLPLDGKVDPVYLDSAFAKDTHWNEFLAALK